MDGSKFRDSYKNMEDDEFAWEVLGKLLHLFVMCDDVRIIPMLFEVRERQRKVQKRIDEKKKVEETNINAITYQGG